MKHWIEINTICHRLWIQLFKEGRIFIAYESWSSYEIRFSQLMNYHVEIEIIRHRAWLWLFKEGVIFIVYESWFLDEIRSSQLMNYRIEIESIRHRIWLWLFKEGMIFIVYESCSSYEMRFSQLMKVVFRLKEWFYSSIWPMEKRKNLDSGWRRGFDSYKRGVNRGWRLWDGSLSACPRRSRCRYG